MQPEDWQRVATVAGTASVAGLIVALLRGIVEQVGGVKLWAASIAASCLVSVLAGLLLHDTDLGIYSQAGLIGLAALISRDLWLSIQRLASMMATNPFEFLGKLRDIIKGKS